MKKALAVITALACVPLAAADRKLFDDLPQAALQSAFQILRRDYIRRDELTFEELNRAALQGLLERLNFSVELLASDGKKEAATPEVHAEFLAPDIAYLRPETFAEGEAALFEKELAKITEGKARHLILDLRGTRAPGSFDEAALMLQCFVPEGGLMFKMKQIGQDDAELFISKRAPLWTGRIVALIDADTNNAAEALAACLRQQGRVLLIGTATRGAAVRFAEVKLDDKTLLRYASAEMMLPDGSTVFKKGLQPDIAAPGSMSDKRKVFDGGRGAGMKPFVNDLVRPRYNEVALVHDTNPELDDYVRRSKGEPLPGDKGQLRDVVTQRALDLLHANDFISRTALQPASAK